MAQISKLIPFEEWRDIPGFEGYYEVSCLGNIRRKGRLNTLKCRFNKDGYLLVNLCVNNTHYTKQLHRLVALAFIENRFKRECVNHIDECKTNNAVNNLEWCSISYNNNYGSRNNNYKKAVAQISKDGERIIETFESMLEAYIKTGIAPGGISNCIRGKAYTAGGYKWCLIA